MTAVAAVSGATGVMEVAEVSGGGAEAAARGGLAAGRMRHGGIGACPISGDDGCRTGFAATGAFGASGAVGLGRSG
jgi:hypothetical protein